MQFFEELKKRNVFRIAALYLVAAWLVAQVGDLVFDAFELPPAAMRWLIGLLLIGFPLALVLSWVFELTDDGIVRESDIANRAALRANPKRMWWLIGGTLLIALALFIATRTVLDTRPADNTVAVLPFINVSADPDNEYFSDGLSEELLNLLAGIPELRVTARTSSFSFKGTELDLPSIGRLLNVAHVLEGSVRKSGDQLRVTAQLIDVGTGYQVWSDTYDRKLDDVFAIQDDISGSVVDALRVSLLGEPPRARVTQPEAFNAFLNGLHFYRERTRAGYLKALEYAEQSVAIDPEYAPAWNLMSATYSNQALRGEIPYDEGHELAMEAVEKALAIDPDYSFAVSARAWIAMNYERDYVRSAALFRRAIRLDPDNPVILGNRAVLANRLGRINESIAMLQQSIDLDPVSSTSYNNMSDLLARANQPVASIRAAEKAIELAPDSAVGYINLAAAYILAEQPRKALEVMEGVDWPVYQLLIQALAHGDAGNTAAANAAADALIEGYADSVAFRIASLYAWRGETEVAYQWLNRAIDEGQPTNGIRNDPFFRSLHDDPRWEDALTRVGLSDEQVAAIDF